jgi:hypothetical protein
MRLSREIGKLLAREIREHLVFYDWFIFREKGHFHLGTPIFPRHQHESKTALKKNRDELNLHTTSNNPNTESGASK